MSNLFKNYDVCVDEPFCLKEQPREKIVINLNSDIHIADNNLSSNPLDEYIGHKKSIILEQAKADAEKIIIESTKDAHNMRATAALKIKMEYETAKKNGYDDGLHQGKEETRTQIDEIFDELKNLIMTIDNKKVSLINDYEVQIKDLVMNIVKKLISVELEKDDSSFINIYKNAVKDFNDQEWIKIIVSNCQYEFATANSELLKSMVRGAKYIEIVNLDDAPTGTCIVETPQGIVNASINIQLDKIREAFVKSEVVM